LGCRLSGPARLADAAFADGANNPLNATDLNQPDLSNLLHQADKEPDQAKRMADYNKAEQAITIRWRGSRCTSKDLLAAALVGERLSRTRSHHGGHQLADVRSSRIST